MLIKKQQAINPCGFYRFIPAIYLWLIQTTTAMAFGSFTSLNYLPVMEGSVLPKSIPFCLPVNSVGVDSVCNDDTTGAHPHVTTLGVQLNNTQLRIFSKTSLQSNHVLLDIPAPENDRTTNKILNFSDSIASMLISVYCRLLSPKNLQDIALELPLFISAMSQGGDDGDDRRDRKRKDSWQEDQFEPLVVKLGEDTFPENMEKRLIGNSLILKQRLLRILREKLQQEMAHNLNLAYILRDRIMLMEVEEADLQILAQTITKDTDSLSEDSYLRQRLMASILEDSSQQQNCEGDTPLRESYLRILAESHALSDFEISTLFLAPEQMSSDVRSGYLKWIKTAAGLIYLEIRKRILEKIHEINSKEKDDDLKHLATGMHILNRHFKTFVESLSQVQEEECMDGGGSRGKGRNKPRRNSSNDSKRTSAGSTSKNVSNKVNEENDEQQPPKKSVKHDYSNNCPACNNLPCKEKYVELDILESENTDGLLQVKERYRKYIKDYFGNQSELKHFLYYIGVYLSLLTRYSDNRAIYEDIRLFIKMFGDKEDQKKIPDGEGAIKVRISWYWDFGHLMKILINPDEVDERIKKISPELLSNSLQAGMKGKQQGNELLRESITNAQLVFHMAQTFNIPTLRILENWFSCDNSSSRKDQYLDPSCRIFLEMLIYTMHKASEVEEGFINEIENRNNSGTSKIKTDSNYALYRQNLSIYYELQISYYRLLLEYFHTNTVLYLSAVQKAMDERLGKDSREMLDEGFYEHLYVQIEKFLTLFKTYFLLSEKKITYDNKNLPGYDKDQSDLLTVSNGIAIFRLHKFVALFYEEINCLINCFALEEDDLSEEQKAVRDKRCQNTNILFDRVYEYINNEGSDTKQIIEKYNDYGLMVYQAYPEHIDYITLLFCQAVTGCVLRNNDFIFESLERLSKVEFAPNVLAFLFSDDGVMYAQGFIRSIIGYLTNWLVKIRSQESTSDMIELSNKVDYVSRRFTEIINRLLENKVPNNEYIFNSLKLVDAIVQKVHAKKEYTLKKRDEELNKLIKELEEEEEKEKQKRTDRLNERLIASRKENVSDDSENNYDFSLECTGNNQGFLVDQKVIDQLSDCKEMFDKAYDKVIKGEYKQAIPIFESILTSNNKSKEDHIMASYGIASCYLQIMKNLYNGEFSEILEFMKYYLSIMRLDQLPGKADTQSYYQKAQRTHGIMKSLLLQSMRFSKAIKDLIDNEFDDGILLKSIESKNEQLFEGVKGMLRDWVSLITPLNRKCQGIKEIFTMRGEMIKSMFEIQPRKQKSDNAIDTKTTKEILNDIVKYSEKLDSNLNAAKESIEKKRQVIVDQYRLLEH